MSLPVTDISPFAARRRRLLDWMRAQGGGIALLPTAAEALRNRDADFPYRHDSDFYYLTGFTEPEAWVVLLAGEDDERAILFCRSKHPEREIWDGVRFGPEAAAERFGFDQAQAVETLDEALPGLLLDRPAVFAPLGEAAIDARLRRWLEAARRQGRGGHSAPARLHDLRARLAEMRLVKDASEIAAMRHAAEISAAAHVRAMRAARPGMHEYEIEAELLYEFRRRGAQSVAYNSIVAAGANACVLHYRAGDTVMRDGDLLLIDAACEYDSYASDITRTFPVNGRYGGPQRALYDLTVAAQQAAADATAPGRGWNEGHDAAVRVLAQGLIDERLIAGSLDGALESRAYERFYMHRTGHWLGLDVHDVGDYREPAAGGRGGTARPWRTLAPGMVLTIEPGLYVRPADDVPEHYWNIGIRTEDDAVVTEDGCELITRGVPVDADEIEALMRG